MTRTTVIHLFHDDPDSLKTGSRLPWRIDEVAADQDVTVEVFCFGPAQARLQDRASEEGAVFNRQIDELIAAGVRVGACSNAARAAGADVELAERGLVLNVARDEFLRFTVEGATVVTF